MHRDLLLGLLTTHRPYDDAERVSLERTIAFVLAHADCFERSLAPGHVTGSAWVVDRAWESVLLTQHRKLEKWLQLGGHADGDHDVGRVALREATEESGLPQIEPVETGVFDVDVHAIPAHGNQSEHVHYDVRFLLRADRRAPLAITEESKDLRWVVLDEVASLDTDASVLRMVAKTRERRAALRRSCGTT